MQKRFRNTFRTNGRIFKWLSVGVFVLLFAMPAQAQSLGGVDFQSFHADVTVNADATFEVVETITGTYLEPRHGIYRNIPIDYVGDYGTSESIVVGIEQVTQQGQAAHYTAYRDGAYETIKIGDPDATITGPFTYVIHYRVARAMLFHDNADELYWNVTGDQWDDPFESVTATIVVPGVAKDDFAVSCYTGMSGSTAHDCETVPEDGKVDVSATDFLTLSISFPKGIIAEPTQAEQARWWLAANWDFLFIPLPFLVALAMYVLWRRHGRDAKGRGTIIPEYDPPDGLRPTEVGTLMDTQLQVRDFSAGVVDLAVRGYLHLTDNESRTLGIFTGHTYLVRREKSEDASLKPFEKEILRAFGEEMGVDVDVKTRGSALMTANKNVATWVYQDLASRGYYARNPNTVRMAYVFAGVGLAMLGFFIGSTVTTLTGRPLLSLLLVASAACIGVGGLFMPKRTEQGTIAREKAMGFKLFLETAEKYRLEWQEREGIFEKFLPYAMVFGVADKWSKTFEGVQQHAPSWYSGNMAGFSAVAFTNHVESFVSTTAQAAAPKSGGGGGGSSGGGFGGGGGGSW